ncbi:hypothetical protein VTJ04DRAFT_8470 [Mycothermus thermophilus]|uniref:uncharacterized protein n=1 Tax=Humicola insolens TaxID=85995 RepID=UPI003743FE7F
MSEEDMSKAINPARASALFAQLKSVNERIAAAAKGREVRLVAVSKLHPANDILALHTSPARHSHFGENYAQELLQKAELLPNTIQWHYIGTLQSGRCKALARIPNLWCVSSVDSLAKAQLLDKARGEKIKADPTISKLNVHVQVNTSGEENKSGCTPGDEVVSLCRAIVKDCPNLHLLGLMTIGAIARSVATTVEGGNEDFRVLVEQRDLVAKDLGIDANELELSMGMSEDFEGAIAMGSSEVRIGSTIFGQRPPKSEAKVVV